MWWLIISSVVVAALVYGYRSHTADARHLSRVFARLAKEHGGSVKKASVLALPQLQFDDRGRHHVVTAMATNGSTSGNSGPFTTVNLQLPHDSGLRLQVRRHSKSLADLVENLTPGAPAATGDSRFDVAFLTATDDPLKLPQLLNARLRLRLLSSKLPNLELRLDGAKIVVHSDGISRSAGAVDEMIDIAGLLADQCPGQ